MTLTLIAPPDAGRATPDGVTTEDHTDSTVARECLLALRGHVTVPRGVSVTVSSGLATLEGIVDWEFQRQVAESAVKYIRGVRNVANRIVIESPDETQAG